MPFAVFHSVIKMINISVGSKGTTRNAQLPSARNWTPKVFRATTSLIHPYIFRRLFYNKTAPNGICVVIYCVPFINNIIKPVRIVYNCIRIWNEGLLDV